MNFNEWFNGNRLGLDFGIKGVGIAVVQGRRVLFAQSLLNLAHPSLEDRRGHRRSRRTHRSRQRRLKEFRKHCIEHGLLDPVFLAHTSDAPHPLIAGRHTPDPRWADLQAVRERLRNGHGSPEDFVRFCYDLCRRRGYTYDSVEDMVLKAVRLYRGKQPTPAKVEEKLLEEFSDACMPQDIVKHILEILDDNDYGSLIAVGSSLRGALDQAVHRDAGSRKSRTKRPRVAVEKELQDVCDKNPVFAGHQAAILKIINWQPRPMRIDNRASTMWKCSWCEERWRPRLKNLAEDKDPEIRDGLLMEAILNLRHKAARDAAESARPWWAKNIQDAVKKKGNIPTEEIRQQVLKGLKEIAPTAGRKDVLSNIRDIFKEYKLADKEVEKFADLLRPRAKEEGRSKRCRECIKLGAKAKSLEDYLRIREMVMNRKKSKQKAVGMEAWVERCVNAIRRTLFYKDPKGKLRFRYGSLQTISLEVPRYDPEEDKSSRQREEDNRQRRAWPFLKQRWWQQGGRDGKKAACIYCGEASFNPREETLSDGSIKYSLPAGFQREHIFPRGGSYNGQDLQINLVVACEKCNDAKGEKTPFVWKDTIPNGWDKFKERVKSSNLTAPTKELLLSELATFPDPLDLLAKTGAVRKVLADRLKTLFADAGIDLTDQKIVFVDGWTTQLARRSWNSVVDAKGNKIENFPRKDRSDPANHAQDAVLAAAVPPHYLRRRGEWLVRERTDILSTGRPAPDWAPHWPEYCAKTKRRPLSMDLTRRRYSWHAQQWDDSIFRRDKDEKFLIRKKLDKVNPDRLPPSLGWAKEQILRVRGEIGKIKKRTDIRGREKEEEIEKIYTSVLDTAGRTVRGLTVYADDVGATNSTEAPPGSKRWRKTLTSRPWVGLRQNSEDQSIQIVLPSAPDAGPPADMWILRLGTIVWLKQDIQSMIDKKRHIWKRGWYRLTKIAGDGAAITVEPCDQPLPFVIKGKKKEDRDLSLRGENLKLLRYPVEVSSQPSTA
ncbi:RRXRR domain-containing protein [bacterium]|nr:RRXRR domain-containing protein [bacterium]